MTTPKSVCVYCGASQRVDAIYKTAAQDLGGQLAKRGIELVYGGGRVGLMGTIADAALAGGGRVVGVIPDHLKALEVDHGGLDELHVVPDMHSRKRKMADLADAFVALPGGMGTLDETFEVLTWKQLHLHDKPIVFLDVNGFWQPLFTLIDHLIDRGFCQPGHRRLYAVATTIDEVFAALAEAPEPQIAIQSKWL